MYVYLLICILVIQKQKNALFVLLLYNYSRLTHSRNVRNTQVYKNYFIFHFNEITKLTMILPAEL